MPTASPIMIALGASGFVGSKVIEILEEEGKQLLTPSRVVLNVLDYKSLFAYIKQHRPEIILNFAAYTDVDKAETQKGNKKSHSWKLNALFPGYLARVCEKFDVFLIHMSTDSVFFDFKNHPNGFREITVPKLEVKKLSWYGYTKLVGEKELLNTKARAAIVRISYPFGNVSSEKDYILKTEKYIKSGVSFFDDFYFTPTFIPDLAHVTEKIISLKKPGVYHVVSSNDATPYQVATYVNKKLKLKTPIKTQNLKTFLRNKRVTVRPKRSSLNSKATQRKLGVKFHKWQSSIDKFIEQKSFTKILDQ